MEKKMLATMWKSIKSWVRNWCQKWPCILFGAIYRKNKQCSVTVQCSFCPYLGLLSGCWRRRGSGVFETVPWRTGRGTEPWFVCATSASKPFVGRNRGWRSNCNSDGLYSLVSNIDKKKYLRIYCQLYTSSVNATKFSSLHASLCFELCPKVTLGFT